MHLNDTHPAIAVVELMRVLIDEENLAWEKAWNIVTKVFSYTNHAIAPEVLEKWPVELMGSLLPRHLQVCLNKLLYFRPFSSLEASTKWLN